MKMIECPTCEGQGEFMVALHPENGPTHRNCHHCGGSGEIEADDDFDEEEDSIDPIDYDDYKQGMKEAQWEAQWEYDNER